MSGTLSAIGPVSDGGFDEPELVAQPLDRRAGDEHRALERVGRRAARVAAQRREQPAAADHAARAGVQHQERTGAVGVLGHPGLEAALAEERRLLVARDARDRDPGRHALVGRRLAEDPGAGADLRQHRRGDAEDLQQLRVEAALVDVVEQRARGVRGIRGVDAPAGEAVDQPRVDRAEGDLAGLGARPQRRIALQQPRDLAAREVGVEHEAGALVKQRLVPRRAQALAHGRRLAALPHDRAPDGVARAAIPEHRRLALVGDPDRADSTRRDARGGHGFGHHTAALLPDLQGVVLDPAGLRVVLLDLGVRAPEHLAFGSEDERGRAGGALVEGQDHGVGAGHGPGL